MGIDGNYYAQVLTDLGAPVLFSTLCQIRGWWGVLHPAGHLGCVL